MKSDFFAKVQVYPVAGRLHYTQVSAQPTPPSVDWQPDGFEDFIDRMVQARKLNAPVIVFLGSRVLQVGLQPYLIDLVEQGWVTHVATTGAANEYDIDVAMRGVTDLSESFSDDLSHFGMWKETGDVVHKALALGFHEGKGYGESIGEYITLHQEQFPHREKCLIYHTYLKNIPYTCHITIGLDEVHVHPEVDFAVLGGSSGIDFKIFCKGITRLEEGIFLNFGSTVTGVEVFLKALSIARNLGYTVKHITTANFDVVRLGDYHQKVGYEDWEYYYRPRKNVVHRPTSLGGKGFHFEAEHQLSIPTIWRELTSRGGELRGS
ncbi:hypothetical protein D2Q93_08850 [Alicyclobacillaceae bacterium I2511]|jgi:hypothetical protein|nr:hypothetical protein D2Q93_08850 [Alicyclobacillaceae bacterium I2511]